MQTNNCKWFIIKSVLKTNSNQNFEAFLSKNVWCAWNFGNISSIKKRLGVLDKLFEIRIALPIEIYRNSVLSTALFARQFLFYKYCIILGVFLLFMKIHLKFGDYSTQRWILLQIFICLVLGSTVHQKEFYFIHFATIHVIFTRSFWNRYFIYFWGQEINWRP